MVPILGKLASKSRKSNTSFTKFEATEYPQFSFKYSIIELNLLSAFFVQ